MLPCAFGWAVVGVWLNTASEGPLDDGLCGASDGETVGTLEGWGIRDGELMVVLEARLEGVSEGESGSARGRASDAESVGELVAVGLGVCAGVGSRGSVQTGCPSATYHTSLCLLSSFKGLQTYEGNERDQQNYNPAVCLLCEIHQDWLSLAIITHLTRKVWFL